MTKELKILLDKLKEILNDLDEHHKLAQAVNDYGECAMLTAKQIGVNYAIQALYEVALENK